MVSASWGRDAAARCDGDHARRPVVPGYRESASLACRGERREDRAGPSVAEGDAVLESEVASGVGPVPYPDRPAATAQPELVSRWCATRYRHADALTEGDGELLGAIERRTHFLDAGGSARAAVVGQELGKGDSEDDADHGHHDDQFEHCEAPLVSRRRLSSNSRTLELAPTHELLAE